MKMKDEWENLAFTLSFYKETDLPILASCEDIQTLLDDHIVKTLTMKNSIHVKPFKSELLEWENKIDSVQKIIDKALLVSVWCSC